MSTGQHECVQLINNYFSLGDLEEYTKPQGVDQKPRLQSSSVSYLHRLITTTHIHPVKVSWCHSKKFDNIIVCSAGVKNYIIICG